MIETIKTNEQVRQEYRLMSTFEMDARDKGFSEGSYQKALETAKLMRYENLGIELISKVTGLPKEKIEAL